MLGVTLSGVVWNLIYCDRREDLTGRGVGGKGEQGKGKGLDRTLLRDGACSHFSFFFLRYIYKSS